MCLTERFLAHEAETTTFPTDYIEQVEEDLKGQPLIATAFVERELRRGLATHAGCLSKEAPGLGTRWRYISSRRVTPQRFTSRLGTNRYLARAEDDVLS